MKTVKRLSSLEIDEVSLVDRPANQHGLVAFTKRAEDEMGYFDAEGNPVAEDDLQPGDIVYTSNGGDAQELVILSEDQVQALEEEGHDPSELTVDEILSIFEQSEAPQGADDLELAGVGKSAGGLGRQVERGLTAVRRGGRRAYEEARTNPKVSQFGSHVGRNKTAYTAAGAFAGGRMSKSLGREVLEELSKAATDGERDQVIAKAAQRIETAERRAAEAVAKAERLEEQAERAEFTDIAKSYQLPVDPEELGEVLRVISKALTPDQLDLVDQVLTAAGAGIQLTGEIGSAGHAPSEVMDILEAQALTAVGKFEGITPEQAMTALLEANPQAYDQYLAENR